MNKYGQPADPPKPLFKASPVVKFDAPRTAAEHALADTHSTDWVFESASPVSGGVFPKPSRLLALALNPLLPYRTVYCYFELAVAVDDANYAIQAEIVFWKAGRKTGRMPASIGSDSSTRGRSSLATSIASAFANSGIPGPESILVQVPAESTIASSETTAHYYLTPSRIIATADLVTFEVVSAVHTAGTAPAGLFVAMGIKSFSHPW